MRVLVTGVTGFIGSRVAHALLAQGDEVTGIALAGDNTSRINGISGSVDLRMCDLADTDGIRSILEGTHPELAIHLAWYAVPGKYWTAEENLDCVIHGLNLARMLVGFGCNRFIGAGTCAEYDWSYECLSEDTTPCKPKTLYGAAKYALYVALERYCAATSMTFAWPRYNFIYGPDEPNGRLVPSVIAKLLSHEIVALTEGTQVRDFLHVDDVASATIAIAKGDIQGAVNVGSGNRTTVKQVALEIGKQLESVEKLHFGEIETRPGDPSVLVPDIKRLHSDVGWKPSYSLEDGIAHTIRSYLR